MKTNFISFEYVDRNYNSKIVQIGMFEKITKDNIPKTGVRFICPSSKEYNAGITDIYTNKPILLFVKKVSQFHITYGMLETSKGNPAIAWDLCYILRDNI